MDVKQKVQIIVSRIPRGKVVYFGQICEVLANEFETIKPALVVGYIMSGVPERDYPSWPGWHRVVVKSGFVASLKLGIKGILQIEMLRAEGVEVVDNVVDMKRYGIPTSELFR